MNASTWNQVIISDETEELVKASLAPSTVETYRLAMQQLEKWLDGRVLNDNLLATYITGLYQDGKSPATISKIVAAVKWTTKNQGIRIPFEITEKALAGIRRKGKGRGRGQVDGITWEEVERICALAEARETVAGLRDSALIRLMSDCLLRISEAVAVDVEGIRDSALRIHQSKTNPGTTGIPDVTLYIGEPTQEAIKRYCEAANITEGPLFRWIRRSDNITDGRLTIDGVRKIIKRRGTGGGCGRQDLWPLASYRLCYFARPSGCVCCEYAGRRTVEIASDAGALRPRRINRARRDCTVQIREMTVRHFNHTGCVI